MPTNRDEIILSPIYRYPIIPEEPAPTPVEPNNNTCNECGCAIAEGEGRTQPRGYGRCETLCEACYNSHMESCRACGNQFNPRESWFDYMCPSCADAHFLCDGCGGTLHNDDYGEEGFCRNCWEERRREEEGVQGPIHEYHSGSRAGLVFHPNCFESLYFGVELETDHYNLEGCDVAKNLVAISNEENLFWLESDSSLDRGVEIISQPCTLDYHLDKFPWTEIGNIVRQHGGKSHNARTCGLHIHFSRTFFDGNYSNLYQLRLIYLFEKFWDELVRFSRRDARQLDHNARKYDVPIYDTTSYRKMRELHHHYGRYQAVNLTMPNTIEVRIFRGTLRVQTILASIELVDFLVRLARSLNNKKLQSLTWAELLKRIKDKKYRYLPQYLEDVGLNKDKMEVEEYVSNSSET